MPIPWKPSGEPDEAPVNRSKGLNILRKPTSTALEKVATTLLLPLIIALFIIRFLFRYDLAKYFSKYER